MLTLGSAAPVITPGTLPMLLFVAKATLLLFVALGASVALRRASAGSRHLVWLVALAALLLLPALTAWSPLRLAVLPPPATPAANVLPSGGLETDARIAVDQSVGDVARAPSIDVGRSPNTEIPAGGSFWSAWSAKQWWLALAAVWAVVAVGIVATLAHGALTVRRIVRGCQVLDGSAWRGVLFEVADRLGLDEPPRLVLSDDVRMPFACGFVRATVVLPAEAADWTDGRRRAVLLHELGHVRRRDLVGHTVGRLACAMYWFHPLVWTAARRLRVESERACDDLALTCGARASDYAEHLLEIVSSVRHRPAPAVALPMGCRSEFEGRVLAILDPALRRGAPSRKQTAALLGGLTALCLSLSAAVPTTRRAEAAPVPASTTAATTGSLGTADGSGATSRPRKSGTVEAPRQPDTNRAAVPAPSPVDNSDTGRALAALTDTLNSAQARSRDRAALLAEVLRTDSSADLRRVAAWGLAQHDGSEVGAQALANAVRRDASAAVREMAAWALASVGHRGTGVVEALSAAARNDDEPRVRATAIWALGSTGDEDAVPALAVALRDEKPEIRSIAAWAIGSVGADRAPRELIAALSDKEKDVRYKAAWALFNIRDAEAASALSAALRSETDNSLRHAYIRALGSLGDRAVPALEELLVSRDSTVRDAVIRSLAGQRSHAWPMPMPRPRPQP